MLEHDVITKGDVQPVSDTRLVARQTAVRQQMH